MGRPLRFIAANVTYHTYSRCINNEDLLKSDIIKEILIQSIQETQDMYDFELNAFEILSDHIHLIITTKNTKHTISRIMQRIKSVTARRYNRFAGRTGPFWNERFGSIVVDDFLRLNLSIAYSSNSNISYKNPKQRKYSSFPCFVTRDFISKLVITFHQHYQNLGETRDKQIAEYLRYEKQLSNQKDEYIYKAFYHRKE